MAALLRRLHVGLAVLYPLLLAAAGTTAKDGVWILLALVSVVRLPWTWRSFGPLLRQPLAWALLIWPAWRALSLLWSVDPASGWDELRAARALLLVPLMWPVADRAAWLIVSFLAGVLLHNVAQLGQALHLFGLRPGANGRLEGFLHPVHTGALCAAALCWHVSAMLHLRGRPAGLVATIIGFAAAAAGLVFAGSRGPWLAAALSVPAAVAGIGLRRRATRKRAALLAVAGLVVVAASWPLAGGYVRLRTGQAVEDLRAAFGEQGDFDTDVGRRLDWWVIAWDIATDHPLRGTGAGGFDEAVAARGNVELGRREHHAHNLYMHELASLGVPGLLAALVVLGLLCRSLWRAPPGVWSDGTLYVLAGWAVGALSDSYQLNGTMFGLLGLIAVLALAPHAGPDGSEDDPQQDAGVQRPG